MTTHAYLETFFEEKNLGYRMYEVPHEGDTHMIDSDTVIQLILAANNTEQTQIAQIIRKIDFANGDIHHFLAHLATGYITQGAAA